MQHLKPYLVFINNNGVNSIDEKEVTQSEFIDETTTKWIDMTASELKLLDELTESLDQIRQEKVMPLSPAMVAKYRRDAEESDPRFHIYIGEIIQITIGKISKTLWTVVSQHKTKNGNSTSYKTKYYLENSIKEAIETAVYIGVPEIVWVKIK